MVVGEGWEEGTCSSPVEGRAAGGHRGYWRKGRAVFNTALSLLRLCCAVRIRVAT